jgi:hypothetical protein
MRIAIVGLLTLAVGCSSGGNTEQQDSATDQRTRDSAVAASNLPGAHGVQGALSAADSAAARRAREDSLAREQ